MSGGDAVGANARSFVDKMMELDVVVTQNAWAWRLPAKVTRNERRDNSVLKFVFEIENVKGNSEMRSYSPGIPDVIQRTAPTGSLQLGIVGVAFTGQFATLVPELHREADE